MSTWENIRDAIIQREGGYVNHPDDRGGPTKYGITQRVARASGYTGPMEDMPLPLAQDIYTRQFWKGPGFDKVAELCPAVATEMADTGTNMGPKTATKFLQRALSVLTRKLEQDGVIGPATLGALKEYLDKRGPQGAQVLLAMLNAQQSVRYIELAEADDSQRVFEYGWQRLRVV